MQAIYPHTIHSQVDGHERQRVLNPQTIVPVYLSYSVLNGMKWEDMDTQKMDFQDILAKRTSVTPGAREFFEMVDKATNKTVLMTEEQKELLIEELSDVAGEYESCRNRLYLNSKGLRKFARKEAMRIAQWVNTCKGF